MVSQFMCRKEYLLHKTHLKKTLQILTYVLGWLYFIQGLTPFSSLSSPSLSLCSVFDSISSSIDEVLSINPSANAFVFGDLDVNHKDCLTYYGGTT